MLTLGNRHVAVIGGSAGIGLAVAKRLAARGARVTIGGRNADRLERAREEVRLAARGLARGVTSHRGAVAVEDGDVGAVAVDACDVGSLRRFYDEAGPLDDLIVTATRRGGGGPADALAGQDLVGAFAGKPVAHLNAVALALPSLAADGSITLLTAASAQATLPGTTALAAINGALEAAVPPLARELAPRRVNAVSPGLIETGWWDVLPEPDRQATFEAMAAQAPVARNGTADEVAHAVVSLIENGFITGVVLPCDGGVRLT